MAAIQNIESAYSSDEPEKKSQPQSPQSQEQGNRRLRRYEAKMARKNANKK